MLEGKYLMYGDSLEDVYYVRKKCSDHISAASDNSNTRNINIEVQPVSNKSNYVNSILDKESIHVVVYDNKQPIGCGSMTIVENNFWFNNINVIKEQRRKKVGDFILRLLIEKAEVMNATKIYITCNNCYQVFFNTFGFDPCAYPNSNKTNTFKDNAISNEGNHCMCLELSKYTMHKCCNK